MAASRRVLAASREGEHGDVPTGTDAHQERTLQSPLGLLLRFISCGILSIIGGLTWRLTLAPARLGVASALAGILCLLAGFIVGGLLWYLRDARLRQRRPGAVSEERLAFSFIVFAVVPFLVLALVGLIWLLALFIGVS